MTLTPDQINGGFEFVGAAFNFMNVRALYKAKRLVGVAKMPTIFFTAWGLWNLYFYPANGLWWSFRGGAAIVLVNSIWLFLAARYHKGPERLHWEAMGLGKKAGQ